MKIQKILNDSINEYRMKYGVLPIKILLNTKIHNTLAIEAGLINKKRTLEVYKLTEYMKIPVEICNRILKTKQKVFELI